MLSVGAMAPNAHLAMKNPLEMCKTASGAVLLTYECRSDRSDWEKIDCARPAMC